jgi:hypothetical protein
MQGGLDEVVAKESGTSGDEQILSGYSAQLLAEVGRDGL